MSLIRVKRRASTKYTPNRNVRAEDAAKRVLQKGMARVALRAKRDGQGSDASGIPFRHANQLAEGYSERGLRRLADQVTGSTSVAVGCPGCDDEGEAHIWPCSGPGCLRG